MKHLTLRELHLLPRGGVLVSPSALRPDQQLVKALKRASWPLDADGRMKLQGHVCAFVDERRKEGWSVERVIVAMKQLADESGIFRGDPGRGPMLPPRDAERLVTTMVTWCIEHFYRPLPE